MIKNFSLRSVKITKNKVEMSWVENEGQKEFSLSSKTPVHPDLTKAVNRLRPVFRAVFGFKDSAFAVTGASFKGEAEAAGLNVMGRFATESGKEIGLSTHRMLFTEEVYGFEHELEEIRENIEVEAYEYIYEGKSSQGTLDFKDEEEPENEQEDVPEKEEAAA